MIESRVCFSDIAVLFYYVLFFYSIREFLTSLCPSSAAARGLSSRPSAGGVVDSFSRRPCLTILLQGAEEQ